MDVYSLALLIGLNTFYTVTAVKVLYRAKTHRMMLGSILLILTNIFTIKALIVFLYYLI